MVDNKLWCKHAMEYYSAIEKDDVLIHATRRRNLQHILSERSQTQKVRNGVILYILDIQNR